MFLHGTFLYFKYFLILHYSFKNKTEKGIVTREICAHLSLCMGSIAHNALVLKLLRSIRTEVSACRGRGNAAAWLPGLCCCQGWRGSFLFTWRTASFLERTSAWLLKPLKKKKEELEPTSWFVIENRNRVLIGFFYAFRGLGSPAEMFTISPPPIRFFFSSVIKPLYMIN